MPHTWGWTSSESQPSRDHMSSSDASSRRRSRRASESSLWQMAEPPDSNRGVEVVVDLLRRLNVPSEGIVYVQSSADWLQRLGVKPLDVIAGLRAHAPAARLAMPSYPSIELHHDYVARAPVFDVRRTPVGVGLIPELFRRTPGTARSLEPDYPIAALGPAATVLTGGIPEDDPFGAQSPYRRILDKGGTLVGLGVSLNTNSFVHAFDSAIESEYPFALYDNTRISVQVTTSSGERLTVPRRVLRPEFQRFTEPSAIAAAIDDDNALTAFTERSVQLFRWDLASLERWALEHAREQLRVGQRPCWLRRVPV